MRLVVAYVDRETVEPIRTELLALGFLSMSVLEASGSTPEVTMTATYRGAAMEGHLRAKARIECVVGSEHAAAVFDTVLKTGGERAFAFVLPVEQAYPTDAIKLDEVAVSAE